ncbi:unnamed protein product [Adineta steineri]|uniref:Uncharacterized protein n=1 Tax=Adineta steineri TaxID=433720 RepID=A0A813WJI7_9BILA|nr:unnamed protein product [Adineta steineri]CAF4138958.1 unnamed protein product [Adineta steineri]
MGCKEKITTHLSTWPTKLTTVMDIHRKRYSQLNPRFKQQRQQQTTTTTTTTLLQPIQEPAICPVILPSTTRLQTRYQVRSKQYEPTHLPSAQTTQRPNTSYKQQPVLSSDSNQRYITLANLTKILHVLQTHAKPNDSEASMNMSTSTTNSTKQRVQQHLQETAARWWKPIRLSERQSPSSVPSSLPAHTTSTTTTTTQVPSTDVLQQRQNNPSSSSINPLSSTRQTNIPSIITTETSRYDESESSTEIQPSTAVTTSIIQPSKTPDVKRIRHEPLIMQTRAMRHYSYDHHRYYNNSSSINFLQQHRLIRQT